MPLDRVCIVMLGAVGDVVHTLPVVRALRRARPHMTLSWVLQPGPAALLEGHPDVDDIIIFHRKSGLAAFADLRRKFAERRYDVALAMQSYFKAGLITKLVPATVKLGFGRDRARDLTWIFNTHSLPRRGERHFQDQYLEFAEALGVDPEPLQWPLGPWPHEEQWRNDFAGSFQRPIASIVVGASRPEREWIPERWIEVCRALYQDFGLAPVLVGGRSGREIATQDRIMRESGVPIVSTLGESFRRLVAILDCSALVITPNTGPMHMAVALNRPTISLHGFGNPRRVGPYRRFHDLMIDRYGDPGEEYPITRKNRTGRMQLITATDVLQKVELWRERYAPGLSHPSRSGPKS